MSYIFQTSCRSFQNSAKSYLIFYPFIAINFTFIFFASLHLNFLSLKPTSTGDTPCHLVEMEQHFKHDNSLQKNFSERVINEHGEKLNKCNQCDFASSRAGNLRTHLKTHSGETFSYTHLTLTTKLLE